MWAVVFDKKVKVHRDHQIPRAEENHSVVRVTTAGICGTDLEIVNGYAGFTGVLGHEFVGVVERSATSGLVGKRVVSRINIGCGNCPWCYKGIEDHCAGREVIGIRGRDGCMAQYCALPDKKLVVVPDRISDDRAVFIEPLSAACRILRQLGSNGFRHVVVLGDGRLGILCAWVLSTVFDRVTLVGKHPKKLALARWNGVETLKDTDSEMKAEIVVEATGTGAGIVRAMELCAPMGEIVLKSTVAHAQNINLSPAVINEQTIIGSRCGNFFDSIELLQKFSDMPIERLISARYPIQRAVEAFDRAMEKDAVKVLIDCNPTSANTA